MTIGAYLGVAGLVDVGYRFYTSTETAVAARVTAGITDAGDGWYSASVTLPTTSASVRWDSTGTAEAKAREYWSDPWGNPVPNGYPSGTAGYVLGTNLDATVSSRATPAQVATELGTYGALKPTTAGRTLDVTTGGEAGVDWANIGAPTTAQNLSGTTISTSQAVASVSGSVGSVTGAVGSVTGAVGSVTSPVTLTAAYDAAKTAATQASVNTIDDFVDTEVAAIKVVTDKLDSTLVVDGAVYQYTANALELGPAGGGGGLTQADVRTAIGMASPNLDTQLTAIDDAIDTEVAAIKAKTDNLPSDPADASDVAASFATVNTKLDSISTGLPLDTTELNAIADALLKRDWTLVTGEASRSMLNALRLLRNKWTTVETANTLTVKKEDDSTSAWTAPLTTDATAAPITSMDPV